MAVQVTMYLNEGDRWHRRPLHLEVLNYLRKEGVYAATASHAVAGFLAAIKWRRRTSSMPASFP
jgi:PII-like signaling protein